MDSITGLCRACRTVPPPFVRAVAYGLYQDRMKSAIHALKYDRLHPAAHELGRMLATAIAQLAADAPAEMLVIPVPLHRLKHAERGFNQARSIAVEALRFLRKSHPDWKLTLASSTLMRLKATDSQAGLNPRQRRMNVRGAFTVSNQGAVTLKHVLVIDDIFTTGATARAAAQALAQAGAASVWVATLARARRLNQTRFDSTTMKAEDNPGLPPHGQGPVRGDPGLTSNALAAIYQEESIYSSHGKSSF